MQRIAGQVNREAATFGIEVVDVRIRRADLPEANSQAVYRRMQTERQREANDIRARGEEEAQRIRSRADREVVVIESEAERESQVIRGEGDGERNKLFADAFGRDPEFFSFYRSMQAYESGLRSGNTRLVLSPDSDFFRYFKDPLGGSLTAPVPVPSGAAADGADPVEEGEGEDDQAAGQPTNGDAEPAVQAGPVTAPTAEEPASSVQ